MSLLAPPATFGLMFPFKAERSRNKERLESSLAALCELELLKQRQESRVLSALCLGDCGTAPGRTAWMALRAPARCATDAQDSDAPEYGLRLQTSSLQCTPWGIMASLEQQVAKLKVNTEVKLAHFHTDLEDSQLPAGEGPVTKEDLPTESAFHPRFPRSLSAPNGTGDIEPRETWFSELTRSTAFTDALGQLKTVDPGQEDNQQPQKEETYIFGLLQRRPLPPRPSKPRTSLAHDARAVGVVRQSSLCRKDEPQSPKQLSVQVIPEVSTPAVVQTYVPERIQPLVGLTLDQERYPGTSFNDEPPPPYHHLQQNVQHQPGLYSKPKQAPMITNRSISLEYPSCRVISTHVDSSNSDPDSPQNFQNYPSTVPKPQQVPEAEEHLVNAEYIPAQPCRASTRAYAHHHHSSSKGSGASKPNRSTYSPERSHHHPEQQPTVSQSQPSRSRSNAKKCRSSEDKNGATRKQGKKACRSQSENSLQRVPERKYNTVERDGAGSGSGSRGSRSSQSKSKKQQGNGSCRRWQSSLELSQDEADQPQVQSSMQVLQTANQRDHCSKRIRKSRPAHPSYAYPNHNHHLHPHHQHSHHHQHVEYHLESRPLDTYRHAAQGESESSMSDADSPDSSSLSSDSDESGGLVWPQQLPPQLSHPSPAAAPGTPQQQKAFVKIKASHALKKKILRFRTGSLKVMTTV